MEMVFPLTAMQQGMLFHHLREPASAAYFQQLQVRLHGELDTAKLQQAWETVIAHHCALRMRFLWTGDQPRQQLQAAIVLPFKVVDYSHSPKQEHEALRQQFLQSDSQQGFALDNAPLMRVSILRWAEHEWEMVWSHHHLILDGWASGLVLAAVAQQYADLLQGKAVSLPAERPYTDFLQWLGKRDNLAAQDYWRHALRGFEQATSLPVLKRSTGMVAKVLAFESLLAADDFSALSTLSQKTGVTTVSAIMACWGLLLSRYADSKDVLFGVTTSGRPAELDGVEQMVGLFINTIPLRVKHGVEHSIANLLNDVHRHLVASREHEHSSLSRIAEWSELPSGQALFDTIVVYENYPLAVQGNQLGNASIIDYHLQEESNYPLTLIVEPKDDGLHLRLLADTERIEPATAQAMLYQYRFLLQQLAHASGEQAVRDLHLLTRGQREQQLQQWNDTACAYDTKATLASIFVDQVARTPDATALIDAQGSMSYASLQDRVSQVVHAINALGLDANSPVAVRLTRDREMLIALLAVVASGHHYVPIEPQLPAARVMAIFDSLPVRCILTVSSLMESTQALANERQLQLVCVDQTTALPVAALQNQARPQDPAYVIFTSGSTGKPKGVLVLHQKAINLVEWVNHTFDIGAQDKLLFVTSPAFDLSVYDIFGILAAGGIVRIASEAEIADPERLLKIIESENISFWDSAPAALWQLESLLPQRSDTSRLRLIFLSGDWIPLALPDRMKAAFPGVCVVALGGATEATIWSNYHIVGELQPDWVSVPYGRPIQNARYYILDADLQPMPVGLPGDLYIGGDCLADGYVGQPELTAERFLHDPHAKPDAQNARMYKTGDRARFYADGVMEFLGRLDNQVKIRGFRIELGEIEIAMGRHAAIRDAICIVHDHNDGGPASGKSDKELIAYYVLHPGQNLGAEELRLHLQAQLPASMLPAHFLQLDSVPVSVNGKVDRKNLPLPERKGNEDAAQQSGADAVQDIIAAAWSEVLSVPGVHGTDDFFALGGHSLRATAVMARLRAAFSVDLPLRLIFEYSTLQTLAAAVRELLSGHAQVEAAALPTLNRAQGLPLSRAQSRLWFLHQMEPASANYNVALAARLDGNLDQAAFQRAVQQVVARHEILNLRIQKQGQGAVMQAVADEAELAIHVEDIAKENLDVTQINARLKQLASQPFDLENERPVRLSLLLNGDRQAYVLILIHHIATDGWAIALFAQELLQAYAAEVNNSQAFAEPALQYADFSHWWEQQAQAQYLDKEMQYWKQQLAALPRLNLPADFPRPANSNHAGARISFGLDPKLSDDLRRVARQHSATLFMLLLTAFHVVLRHRSGQEDIVVGSDIAGRDHPLAEKIQGFFVNQLVLRSNFADCHSFADMLGKVRQTSLQAYFNQHLPFDLLVQELNPPRDAGGMPLFQHKFVLQNAPLAQLDNKHFQIQAVDLHTDTAKYDLLLTVIDEPQLRATLEFSTELFTVATAQSMQREFIAVLGQVAADASISYASLASMLSLDGAERQEAAKRDLRKSGLQRLKELRKPGVTT
ncbi:non-ribosomal peptide synthetase [Undibacterium pigrum]|uniref:Amino acid adenylation domain-containing protein n=1 Tax=Undibacterium pigrum TaxID=401470 RepID=A0A318J0H8_9BURK|nr:non-ribosomal peptide synthetase [Undibacterium pigrum]PXX40210.1 amino acid adenylation domain-containing protein [Undibacterium pigrum]